MDQKVKERIFGAMVLVSLAMIFLPMIFTGPVGVADINASKKIPPMPKMAERDLTTQEAVSKWQEATREAQTLAKKNNGFGELEPIQAFAIQVATFTKSVNAEQLRDKLLDAGYPAYVKTLNNTGKNDTEKTFSVVMVGPEIEKSEAEKILTKVNKQFKVKGLIVQYRPDQAARSA